MLTTCWYGIVAAANADTAFKLQYADTHQPEMAATGAAPHAVATGCSHLGQAI